MAQQNPLSNEVTEPMLQFVKILSAQYPMVAEYCSKNEEELQIIYERWIGMDLKTESTRCKALKQVMDAHAIFGNGMPSLERVVETKEETKEETKVTKQTQKTQDVVDLTSNLHHSNIKQNYGGTERPQNLLNSPPHQPIPPQQPNTANEIRGPLVAQNDEHLYVDPFKMKVIMSDKPNANKKQDKQLSVKNSDDVPVVDLTETDCAFPHGCTNPNCRWKYWKAWAWNGN
eukprot:459659_1